jgi:hypothetical protein
VEILLGWTDCELRLAEEKVEMSDLLGETTSSEHKLKYLTLIFKLEI